MTVKALDLTARYTVAGYRGVAFYVHGWPKVWEPYTTLDGHGSEYEAETGEGEWATDDTGASGVVVVMVGDDRKHTVDVDDLTPLPEGGYCHGCGQTGCSWET